MSDDAERFRTLPKAVRLHETSAVQDVRARERALAAGAVAGLAVPLGDDAGDGD